MLQHLHIRNYALFAEVDIDFPSGLVILTGETGAGKSLLVGALGLIMGKRADSSVMFRTDEKSVVEATFGHLSTQVQKALRDQDGFDMEGRTLVIRREISPSGKSRAFVNDTPVTLDVLKEISSLLVDLHSQHQNVTLLNHDHQRSLLDLFADNEVLIQDFSTQLKDCERLGTEIEELEQTEATAREQLQYLKFQQEDLGKAGLKDQEEEALEQELQLLHNSEEVVEAVGRSADILYHQEESIHQRLSELLDPLKKVRQVSAHLEEEVSKLEEVSEQLRESAAAFDNLLETVESDPERLAFIEQRLATYHQLKLKYNCQTSRELVELLNRVTTQIDDFGSLEAKISAKKADLQQGFSRLKATGLSIESRRQAACPILEQKILDVLRQVGFEKARFEIAVERLEAPAGILHLEDQRLKPVSSGFNKVYFLIQTNPGMPAGPLSSTASGGEISRVMLAIKAAMADKSDFPVLIFDEIDTGISGEIANKVGRVMQLLSKRFQILSITHLPQIAARGGTQFMIRKVAEDAQTTSSVERLTRENRIIEIAKMLSGDQPSHSAMDNARELLQQ